MTASFERDEPEDGRLNRVTHRQETMILKQSCFFVPKAGSYILALFLGKNDTVE